MNQETKLTRQQNAEIGRTMVRAAYAAMGKYSDDLNQAEMAQRLVRGVIAAERVWKESEVQHWECPDDTPDHAAVTAFSMWTSQFEFLPNDDDFCARSQASVWFMAVAQGLEAVKKISDVLYLLTEDEVYSYGGSGDIEFIAPMLKQVEAE